MKVLWIFVVTSVVTFNACVSSKQYKEALAKQNNCELELASAKKLNDSLDVLNKELGYSMQKLKNETIALVADTSRLNSEVRGLQHRFSALQDSHDLLLDKHKMLESGAIADKKQLAELFEKSQSALIEQEEMLKKMLAELDKRESELSKTNKDLASREKRTRELENIINRKDSAAKALRKQIADALLGFSNNGLSVVQKNGKVYVSVDEKLLFQSGSWAIDPKGLDALKKLSKVLENQSGLGVVVEGHTDSDPYNGKEQIKDNWDLSVMRATAVTKALLNGSKLRPEQVSASGRGEFIPVEKNTSAAAKQKNRRTDIIISPRVDELLKILEQN